MNHIKRRTLLKWGAGAAALALWPLSVGAVTGNRPLRRPIPAGNEDLNVIGLGTWRTFNVGSDPMLRDQRTKVLEAFLEAGGQMVDSSPMYGSSQDMMGYALERLGRPDVLFAADKIWTWDESETRQQAFESARKWNLPRFDLLQVHNLVGWQSHLDILEAMKADGEVRYIGITTSHERRHDEFERIMGERPLDFVQLTYNLIDRRAEQRLLPLAREKGIGVIVNRPFQGGSLVKGLQRRNLPLPPWAGEIGCRNWPQFLLKFIVSHPAVTCAIPATTRVDHVRENMGAAYGPLPDEATRGRMLAYFRSL